MGLLFAERLGSTCDMNTRGTEEPDLVRFGRMVKARRDALGLTQGEVNELGGPSDTTFTKIENLEWRPGRPATLRKLDAGLRWEAGSSARILYESGDPTPLALTLTPGQRADQNSAELAVEVTVRLEEGIAGLWEALRGLSEVPADTDHAMRHLDAASYLAENLALQLAGPELAQRRREARARVQESSWTRADEPTVGPLVTSRGSVLGRSSDEQHAEIGEHVARRQVREPQPPNPDR